MLFFVIDVSICPSVFSEPWIELIVILFLVSICVLSTTAFWLIRDIWAPVSTRSDVLSLGFTSRFICMTGSDFCKLVCLGWQTPIGFPGSCFVDCFQFRYRWGNRVEFVQCNVLVCFVVVGIESKYVPFVCNHYTLVQNSC